MDYRTMVNPTYLTAKSTVFMLAIAGNEDAKRMIAGDGGNGEEKRTEWLRKSGFFNNPALAYEIIQSKVNSMV